MRSKLIQIVIVLVVPLLLSCAAGKVPERLEDITFASVVTSTQEGDVLVLLLETDFKAARRLGVPIEKAKYTKALVRIDKDTKILKGTGLGNERATPNELLKAKPHRFISVWFRGPVKKSNPVQATAKTISF